MLTQIIANFENSIFKYRKIESNIFNRKNSSFSKLAHNIIIKY